MVNVAFQKAGPNLEASISITWYTSKLEIKKVLVKGAPELRAVCMWEEADEDA